MYLPLSNNTTKNSIQICGDFGFMDSVFTCTFIVCLWFFFSGGLNRIRAIKTDCPERISCIFPHWEGINTFFCDHVCENNSSLNLILKLI